MRNYSLILLSIICLSACQSYGPITEPGNSTGEPNTAPAVDGYEAPENQSNPPVVEKENPNSAVLALLSKADKQIDQADYQSAASSLERAIRISPRDANLYFSLARVRLLQENSAQAAQLCRKAVNYASDHRYMELKCEALLAPD